MYRPSLHHHLASEEPILVNLATSNPFLKTPPSKQPFVLEPRARFAQPRTKDDFFSILNLLKERKDWEVFAHFLKEMGLSGRHVTAMMVKRMVKKGAQTGQMGMVVEMFRRLPVTGLKIGEDAEVAMEVMLGAVHRAESGGWEEGELTRAWRNAETALRMMGEAQHYGNAKEVEGQAGGSTAREAEVVGCVLALAGLRVQRLMGGRDGDGRVKELAGRFVECFGRRGLGFEEGSAPAANTFLATWAPSWLGVNIALQVLPKEAGFRDLLGDIEAAQLSPKLEEAARIVKDLDENAEDRRGIKLYNAFNSML